MMSGGETIAGWYQPFLVSPLSPSALTFNDDQDRACTWKCDRVADLKDDLRSLWFRTIFNPFPSAAADDMGVPQEELGGNSRLPITGLAEITRVSKLAWSQDRS